MLFLKPSTELDALSTLPSKEEVSLFNSFTELLALLALLEVLLKLSLKSSIELFRWIIGYRS